MKQLPECQYRYNPIGYPLCDYGNDKNSWNKKHIASCCANACPLNKFPEEEKMTIRQMHHRDMRILDKLH